MAVAVQASIQAPQSMQVAASMLVLVSGGCDGVHRVTVSASATGGMHFVRTKISALSGLTFEITSAACYEFRDGANILPCTISTGADEFVSDSSHLPPCVSHMPAAISYSGRLWGDDKIRIRIALWPCRELN